MPHPGGSDRQRVAHHLTQIVDPHRHRVVEGSGSERTQVGQPHARSEQEGVCLAFVVAVTDHLSLLVHTGSDVEHPIGVAGRIQVFHCERGSRQFPHQGVIHASRRGPRAGHFTGIVDRVRVAVRREGGGRRRNGQHVGHAH